MIFETTLEAIREDLRKSELRLNILRICARAPRTIHDLIHAPAYPGIEMSLFSLQSEINVTVELGECKSRGLLVSVGKVPDPIVPGGTTELVRTSLLAFLASPELARAEPGAYLEYLRAWLSLPQVMVGLGGGWAESRHLFAAFPEVARQAFYSAAGPELKDPYFHGDPRRVFGCFHISDIPVSPPRLKPWELWLSTRKAPLTAVLESLDENGLVGLARLRRSLRLSKRSPSLAGQHLPTAPPAGPELFPGRLLPTPVHTSSPTSRRSKTIPPKRHRDSRQDSISSGEMGSGTS